MEAARTLGTVVAVISGPVYAPDPALLLPGNEQRTPPQNPQLEFSHSMFPRPYIKKSSRSVLNVSPKKPATGFGGGHSYLSGIAIWEGRTTPVFVFLKDEEEEKKIEAVAIDGPLTFDAQRYDFVAGHGLSLWEAELK